MRVLFWSELFWPHRGGVETLAAELVPALSQRGCEVTVVTSHDDSIHLPDRSDHCGAAVRRLPFRPTLASRDVLALLDLRQRVTELKRQVQPDVIHVFSLGPSTLFHLQTRGTAAVPELLTLHGEVLRGGADRGETILEKSLTTAGWVACVSGAVRRAALDIAPDTADRSSVVYNALPLSPLRRSPRTGGPRTVLCIGRFVHDKGFDLGIAAFAAVAQGFPEARLIIAGDGPLRADLAAQAAAAGLGDRVQFPGWIDASEVARLLGSVDILLIPSRREGLPLIAVQAAQMETPTIATAVGGLPEVVDDGVTGVLVASQDPTALAQAIAALLQSPATLERMGHAARAHAAARFGWEPYVDAHVTLYRKLCGAA